MRWKTTLALFVATVAIGAYVSLYELKQPTREEQWQRAREAIRFSASDVATLLVAFPDVNVTLHDENGSWRLRSPLATRAEEPLVRRILNELDPLEAEQAMEGSKEQPLALANFGLQPPRGTLTVITRQFKAATLAFGGETAVGDRRYLKLADSPKVFVVSSRLFDLLNQPLEAYRSHELLAFDAWNADRMTVAFPHFTYSLAKRGDRWQLLQPLADEADGSAASATLNKLRNLRIERFVTDAPQVEQLPTWGFEMPYARITIAFGEETPPLELFIGKPTEENPEELYAKRADEATIYAVSRRSIDELFQDPETLRSRDVLSFLANRVTKLSISWEGASWTAERVNEQWKRAGGEEPLDAATIDETLRKLRDVKLIRFVEDEPQDLSRYGLDPPKGGIQVWVSDAQEPKQMLIGEAIEQGPTRFGRIVGRASVVELPDAINAILTTIPQEHPEPSSSPHGFE